MNKTLKKPMAFALSLLMALGMWAGAPATLPGITGLGAIEAHVAEPRTLGSADSLDVTTATQDLADGLVSRQTHFLEEPLAMLTWHSPCRIRRQTSQQIGIRTVPEAVVQPIQQPQRLKQKHQRENPMRAWRKSCRLVRL